MGVQGATIGTRVTIMETQGTTYSLILYIYIIVSNTQPFNFVTGGCSQLWKSRSPDWTRAGSTRFKWTSCPRTRTGGSTSTENGTRAGGRAKIQQMSPPRLHHPRLLTWQPRLTLIRTLRTSGITGMRRSYPSLPSNSPTKLTNPARYIIQER